MAKPLPSRNEADPAFTWNLEATYATREAFDTDLASANDDLARLVSFRGRLGDSAVTLGDFFAAYWPTLQKLQKLRIYATMPLAVDQNDQEARAVAGRFQALVARFSAELAFAQPELLSIGPEKLDEFRSQDARLADLGRYFERLEASRPFVRSAEVEDVLGRTADPFSALERAYNSLANGELPFEPVMHEGQTYEVERSTFPALRMAADRTLREKSYDSYSQAFLAHKDTFTDLYVGRIKQSVFLAEVRGYEDTLDEQLRPREVPREVLTNVLSVFEKNLGVWHRYWEARRRLLQVDELKEWDVFAPLAKNPAPLPYSEAIENVLQGMAPLGEEYTAPLRKGLLEERWVDVYPNRGKRDGAFATRWYGGPPYIMMSYQDDLESMSTLAHELGHAMHSKLMDASQPPANANYAMAVAETASNFNQALVRSHLLSVRTDPAERLAVLDEAFYNFHRYFFIMPTLVRFELEAHQAVARGEGLTSSRLIGMMQRLFQEGYGDAIQADERTGITWAQFGHLYMPFYTFQYSVGIAAAAALASEVRAGYEAGDRGPAERYLAFLKAGSAVKPLDLFRATGVDMTTPAPIEKAFSVLDGYVHELEELAAAG
ncbi:MAG: oligoendopeptidase F [Truepera sp.]|jgi:oligoendopeptidase F|nr:oligoendopeptidase F [Truepera sp.]HRN18379.1 oligoendopeptidase F [Trueperaceae bacterium]